MFITGYTMMVPRAAKSVTRNVKMVVMDLHELIVLIADMYVTALTALASVRTQDILLIMLPANHAIGTALTDAQDQIIPLVTVHATPVRKLLSASKLQLKVA